MIHIKEIVKHNQLVGFKVSGHARYAEKGKDIVCSAVSVLTINAINTLNEIVKCNTLTEPCVDGNIEFEVEGNISVYADIVLQSAKLGFCNIKEAYPQYIDYEKGDIDNDISK